MDLLGHIFGRNRKQPQGSDAELSALLQQWQGVTERPGFEVAVWCRIRRVSEPASHPWRVFDLTQGLPRVLAGWLTDFGWSTATAAVAGIVVGVWLALAPGTPASAPNATAPLLHRHTLAGSYLSMLAGGPQ